MPSPLPRNVCFQETQREGSLTRRLFAAGVVLVAGHTASKGSPPVEMAKSGPNMTPEMKDLARKMCHDQDKKPEDIADELGRHQSTICRLLFKVKKKRGLIGRPRVLTTAPQVEPENSGDGKNDLGLLWREGFCISIGS